MAIKYFRDENLQRKVDEIARTLELGHVNLPHVICVRSKGSASRNTLARCHALGKIWHTALNTKAYYVIEIISERFDKLDEEDKTKTIIHELLHIPKSFGGGFRHHNVVNGKAVDIFYEKYMHRKK